MRANLKTPIRICAQFWVQKRAPSMGTLELWEDGSNRRGQWVGKDLESMIQKIKSYYSKEEIIEIIEIPQKQKDHKVFKLYGPIPKDRRKKRFRLLLTFRNIRAIKSRLFQNAD